MIVRLIPYSEVFVSATLSLDEATALLDALAVIREKHKNASPAAADLETELESALRRAAALKETRGY